MKAERITATWKFQASAQLLRASEAVSIITEIPTSKVHDQNQLGFHFSVPIKADSKGKQNPYYDEV